LEDKLKKLEKNVRDFQQHEFELEVQRNENLHLKETIDKLKLDLEEIRSSKVSGNFKKYPFLSYEMFL